MRKRRGKAFSASEIDSSSSESSLAATTSPVSERLTSSTALVMKKLEKTRRDSAQDLLERLQSSDNMTGEGQTSNPTSPRAQDTASLTKLKKGASLNLIDLGQPDSASEIPLLSPRVSPRVSVSGDPAQTLSPASSLRSLVLLRNSGHRVAVPETLPPEVKKDELTQTAVRP